jgi:flagellar motor switch protein FliN/FliY
MSSSLISSSSSEAETPHGLNGLLDLTCSVDVVLGTGSITVRDCLKMQAHTVLKLQQATGSDLEVRVHGVPAVRGEVMVVEDTTAIRVTQILPPPASDVRRA